MKENSISYLHQLIAELPKVLFGTYLCKARGLPFSPSAADVLLPTEVSGPGPVLYKLLKLCKLHGGRAPAKQLLQPLWGLERQDTGWLKPRQLSPALCLVPTHQLLFLPYHLCGERSSWMPNYCNFACIHP